MAGIHTMAFSVTLLAALFPLCASSRQINTELRKIITVTDVFSVCTHSHGCQSRAVCPVLHDLLEFVHVTKILNLHITSYFPGYLNRRTHQIRGLFVPVLSYICIKNYTTFFNIFRPF